MKHLTKHFRAILAIAMMLCVALPTFAHDFEYKGIYYDITNSTNKTVKVTYRGSYYLDYSNEYTGSVAIPSSVTYSGTTYSVTSIGSEAFYYCSGLTSVTIPNSVTSIGSYAFYGCRGLTSITIPNSVTSIGNQAFRNCTGLTSVTIPNSVTSIGNYAFYECSGLTSVTIPNSVTSIGKEAFYGCTGLTSIVVEEGNPKYDSRDNCNAIIETSTNTLILGCKNSTIPNSVTEIGEDAFYNCSGLTSVTIPNSVTSIGEDAFYGCSNLETVINLSNLIFSKGSSGYGYIAYYACRVINAPNVSMVEDFVFSKVDNVNILGAYLGNATELILPTDFNGENYIIGDYAFEDCTGLTSVTIPNSVTSIGKYAFLGCSGLTSVTIGNSVTSIGKYAFEYCTGLTSITIPNSVTSIGDKAFYGCSGLTSVTIGNSITSIGSSAFEGCTGLTEVNISDLSAWCKIDFSNSDANPLCYAKKFKLNGAEIKDLVIPNDITEIKKYTFRGCRGLTSITIPNSVTSIGSSAFNNCTGLTSVTIGNSVTSIGSSAFNNCTGLTSVSIGNSVTSIGDRVFWNCKGLASITIPNSVTSIGEEAFYACDGLTSVTIGNSVASIGESAFRYCRGLAELNYNAENCTSMGSSNYSVFGSCSNLKIINIGSSVKSIPSYAFSGCDGLKYIVSLNTLPPVCASSSSFYENNYEGATLYVPKDSYAKYFIDDVWGQFSNIKKIEILVSSITLNNSTIELDKGSTATLSVTIAPSNATIKNIVWTSSNPQIATVDQSGKVTAFTHGTATITAKSIDGSNVSASCKVTVNGPTITLSQIEATLPVNEIMTISYSITNSATKTATWSTSNEYVAYVKTNSDGSATIVGMADGVATITATMVDNGQEYYASCVVTVGVGGVEGVEIDNNAVEVSRYDIHGRLLSEPTKGINIVKMSNGTTRKEIVK